MKKYGSVAKVRHVLCDEIVSGTHEKTVGRMKPLASGLEAGMIKITIEEFRDLVTFECTNSSKGRLNGAWLAVCQRLAKLQESREPSPEDARQGFLITQDIATGLYLVSKESVILGGRPMLLLYVEDRECKGVFFNGAGNYAEENDEVVLAHLIPIARAIITARSTSVPDL